MERPEIRFKGYTDEWEQRKLPEFVSFFNGLTYTPDDVEETGTLVLRSSNVKNGEIIDADNVYVNDKVATSENVQEGDIIVVVRNGSRALIGKHAQIKVSMSNTVIGAFMSGMRSEHSSFVNALLDTSAFENEIAKNMGATINQITGYMFSKMEFMIPSGEEQQQIGEYFQSLDNLITLHQRKCDEVKSLKKYMLQKMFPQNEQKVPEIRFEGFTEAWEQRKLEDYLEVSSEKNRDELLGKEDVLSVSGEVGIVNQIEFQGRSFAGVSVANYGIVEVGDVVYTKSPLKSNPYGIIKTNKGKTGIVSTLYAVYKPKKNVDSEFVQIYFESDFRMNSYMHPLVNKGAKNDMKVSDANALKGPVFFPKIEEQIVISQYFNSLDHLITLHQQKCEELKKIKKFMLQKMFV